MNPPPTNKPLEPLSVAIAGGGIGGLCLAIGLLQYSHLKINIYESAPQFKEIGAGLAVGPNAQRALSLICPATAEAFRRCATPNLHKEFEKTWFDFRNGILGTEGEEAKLSRLENETGQQTVHRAKFLDELVKLVPPEIGHFGKHLVSVEERDDIKKVVLHFTDGTTAMADCLIGADGVHSSVRKHILGHDHPATTASYSGIVSYRGLIPMEEAHEAVGEFADDAYMWCGDGGMVMTYPIDYGKTLNVVASHNHQKSWSSPPYMVSSTNEELMDDFKTWGEIPTKVLQLIKHPTKWAMLDHHHPAPFYNSGPIVIIGDAAHATTPFQGAGAGQAIEDALVLSALFRYVRLPSHVPYAFSAFDAVRRERTQRVVRTSRDAMNLYAFKDGVVNGEPGRWKKVWDERMRWIWEIDLVEHCYEALGRFTEGIVLGVKDMSTKKKNEIIVDEGYAETSGDEAAGAC